VSNPDTITNSWGGLVVSWSPRIDRFISNTLYGFTDEVRLFHPVTQTKNTILCYRGGHDGNLTLEANANMVNIRTFVDAGFRVLGCSMPMLNPNPTSVLVTIGAESTTLSNGADHNSMFWIEDRAPFRLLPIFLDGQIRAINYLAATYPAATFAVCGLSGGGWGTTMSMAVDTRLAKSWDVAGSMPHGMRSGSDVGDAEQHGYISHYKFSYLDFYDAYLLAASGRVAKNVYNDYDPVAFPAHGREAAILATGDKVMARIGPGGSGVYSVAIDPTYNTPPGAHAMSAATKSAIIAALS